MLKKVLFDNDMLKSSRVFSIAKLKNSSKIIDSFIYSNENKLIILTSIGRIFKFDLSNKTLTPNTKQSQGLLLVNPSLGRALIEDALLRFLLKKDYELEAGNEYKFTISAKF